MATHATLLNCAVVYMLQQVRRLPGPRHPIRLRPEASRRAAQSAHATLDASTTSVSLAAVCSPEGVSRPTPLSSATDIFRITLSLRHPNPSSRAPPSRSCRPPSHAFLLLIRRFRQNTCFLRRLKLKLIYYATTTCTSRRHGCRKHGKDQVLDVAQGQALPSFPRLYVDTSGSRVLTPQVMVTSDGRVGRCGWVWVEGSCKSAENVTQTDEGDDQRLLIRCMVQG